MNNGISRFKDKIYCLLILLGLLYFFHPLFLGGVFFFRDLGYDFVPQKQLFAEFVANREFPLWDRYRHGGQPYLGDLNNSTLYPSNVLYLLFPFFRALTFTIVFHVILAVVSAYFLARTLGFCLTASCFTAIVYGFCGCMLSLINLYGRFLAIALLPLFLLCWHKFLRNHLKNRWFLGAVGIGVLQVFAGAPEVNVLSMLFLGGWTWCFPSAVLSSRRKIVWWGLLGTFILGLASIQLFPTVEMSAQSMRGEGIAYEVFNQWSLYPGRLPELIFPGFFGDVDMLPVNVHYWGDNLGDKGYPYILHIYFGCTVMMFALIGGVYTGDERRFPRALRRFLLGTFLILLVLALGRYLPFFPFIYHLPFMTLFRYPTKFLLGGILPVALLAGYTLHIYSESISAGNSMKKRFTKLLIVFWGLTVVLGIFSLLFSSWTSFAQWFQMLCFKKLPGELALINLKRSFFHALAIWSVVTLLFHARRIKIASWQPWLLVTVLAVDLLTAGRRVNFYAPEAFFTATPPAVTSVRKYVGNGRLFRTKEYLPAMIYVEPHDVFDAPPQHVAWLYRWKFEVLSKYLASYYKIPVIFHEDYDLLAQKQLTTLTQRLEQLSWIDRIPLLSAGNVTTILSSEPIVAPEIEQVATIPHRGGAFVTLYQNHRAMGRIAFVTKWRFVESDAEAFALMRMKDYDPRQHVVLQKPEKPIFPLSFGIKDDMMGKDTLPRQCDEAPGAISIIPKQVRANSVSYTVSTDCDGYLVFSEQFYPGWRVMVDGKATPILRANSAFSAIPLLAGKHEIRRYYHPNSLLLGLSCSSGSLCLLAAMVYRRRRTTHNYPLAKA